MWIFTFYDDVMQQSQISEDVSDYDVYITK